MTSTNTPDLIDGYPAQRSHGVDVIPVDTVAKTDSFPFPSLAVPLSKAGDPKDFTLIVPGANVKYIGQWKKVAKDVVPSSVRSGSMTYSAGTEVTESVSHEASVQLEFGVELDVKVFGVGVGVSVSAALGYAVTVGRELGHSSGVAMTWDIPPGCTAEVWLPEVTIEASWQWPDPRELTPRQFATEIYYPSLERYMTGSWDGEEGRKLRGNGQAPRRGRREGLATGNERRPRRHAAGVPGTDDP